MSRLVFILLAAFAPLSVAAEDQRIEALKTMSLEELSELQVSIATGIPRPIRLAPAIAAVVTAAEIEKTGATSLDEVLEAVPGLHVEPSGTGYFSPIWSMRGIHTSLNPQVLLLIDGFPFTFNYQGGRPLAFQMPVSMISRVEVIRGPGSALYGADAFSGIVNVITKTASEIDATKLGARYGSFDAADVWVQHGAQYGGWDVALGVEYSKTDGDSSRIIDKDYLHAIGQANKSNAPGFLDTRESILNARLNLKKEGWDLHVYGTSQDNNLGAGGTQAVTYGNHGYIRAVLTDLSYSNDHLLDNWTLSTRGYFSYMKGDTVLQYFPPDFLNQIGEPIFISKDGGVEVMGLYSGLDEHRVRVGGGFKAYDFDRDQYRNFNIPGVKNCVAEPYGELVRITDPDCIYISKANRHLWYGLLQDEWSLASGWEVTAGVRYDDYSDFGSTTNPRAAVVWEAHPKFTTKLLYGRAFRSPSFGEQHVKNNPVTIGDPTLRPETITTYEWAFEHRPIQNLHFNYNLFFYKAENLIELLGAGPGVFNNHGEQTGKGFESEVDWRISQDLRLRSNFAYQYSKLMLSDSFVPDAPALQVYVSPQWDFLPEWSLNGQLYWIGSRHRALGDPRPAIANYTRVNVTVRKQALGRYGEAAISVRNLLGTDGRIPSPYAPTAPEGAFIPNDYPMEGRSIWGELSFRL